ncbi:MAG: hypothetical protein ACKV0T_26665 [Planctomycetales bacterium]
MMRPSIGCWLALWAVIVPASIQAQADTPRVRKIGPPQNMNPEANRALPLVAPPAPDSVRTRTLEWVAPRAAGNPERLEAIGKLWGLEDSVPSPEELFQRTIRSFCLADPPTEAFVAECGLQRPPLLAPAGTLLTAEDAAPFYTANLGLFYGRYLAQRQMYEEALAVLEPIPLAEVVDPASLLFFRAVCQHYLLHKAEGLVTIEQLLHATEGVPVRYTALAALMQHDLEALADNSLDEIARKMADVERRLHLGRAGEKVQKKEEEIITTLDEIIKKIEDQQGGGGGGAGGQSNRSDSPNNDSVIKGSTAPGNVDPKKFDKTGSWGDMPDKMRARAKNDIARQFGAHYGAAIDEYTKKAASRPAASGK